MDGEKRERVREREVIKWRDKVLEKGMDGEIERAMQGWKKRSVGKWREWSRDGESDHWKGGQSSRDLARGLEGGMKRWIENG